MGGMADTPLNVDTMLQHLGEEEHIMGAVVPPIFQNSLFVFEDCATFSTAHDHTKGKKHVYSRVGNPTVDVVNVKVAALEHTEKAMVFGSGMAAISTAIMSCVKSGSHVVAVDTCYGPTKQFLRDYLPRFGITTTFVTGGTEEVLAAIQENTTLLYLESPSSIVFWMQDLEPICTEAHKRGVKVAIDNSYSDGLFLNPADHGVDIVLHSATKYLCGHSDVVAGALACSAEHMELMMRDEIPLFGSILHPFPAWLMLRGLRTLRVRLKQHQIVGNEVAHWLLGHSRVTRVNHIGLDNHPQADLVKKYMKGSGGLLSFEVKDADKDSMWRIVDRCQVFQRGVSWGGFESLITCMEYAPMNWETPRWVVRVYCGLEDPADLIADLEQALQ